MKKKFKLKFKKPNNQIIHIKNLNRNLYQKIKIYIRKSIFMLENQFLCQKIKIYF